MENIARLFVTEEELLNKLGLNEKESVITGVEFDPVDRDIHITVRTLNEITDTTVKVGFLPRRKRLFNDDSKKKHNTYNITINTHSCDTKSPQELAEQMLKSIKYKGE